MALYPFALFLHIVGMLGLFIAISLEVATEFRLHAAQTTVQVREWMAINYVIEKILPVSALVILASGLFMLFAVWGWGQAWIDLSLGVVIVLGVLGPVINGPRLKAIQKAVEGAPAGEVSASLQKCISDPVLRAYSLVPGLMSLSVVSLMTLKLNWIGSGAVMISALIIGIILGQLPRKASHNERAFD